VCLICLCTICSFSTLILLVVSLTCKNQSINQSITCSITTQLLALYFLVVVISQFQCTAAVQSLVENASHSIELQNDSLMTG